VVGKETIEEALHKILREKVKLIASGRTDSGVHAIGQVANFKTNSKIPLANLKKALNSILPADIVIKKITQVGSNFHARYQAKSKIYRYSILTGPQRIALVKNYFYFLPYKLDIPLLKKEAKFLLGKHNFQAFCASQSKVKDKIRTIKNITIKKFAYTLSAIRYPLKGFSSITIDIEADGFLYNMVRNIIGTLIEIGRGKLPKEALKKILASRDRKLAGPTAPACGLCLLKVKH